MAHMMDLTNQRFGRLVAINPAGKNPKRETFWLCKCDCGKEVSVRMNHLRRGITQSCGCLRIEKQRQAATTHGGKKHRFYSKWNKILDRCYNENEKGYPNYGGRGISVYEEWKNNPVPFCNYIESLPHCGEPGRTLDRIDNDGNYEPGNLRWATYLEQSRNSRINRYLTLNGITKRIMDWEKETGLLSVTIRARLKRGWSIQEALTRPLRQGSNGKAKRWSQSQKEVT